MKNPNGINDVSLDIESAGTCAGYMVVNVGAIYFNRHTGQFGERIDLSLDVLELEEHGYRRDRDTMKWWKAQPDSVQEHCWAGILPVKDALRRLGLFFENCRFNDGEVWVKGEHMDIAMLEFMYDKEGQDIPWYYRAPRDIRTYEAALQDVGGETQFMIPHEGPAHTGLADAIYQARWIMAATQELKRRAIK